jgi:HrpA-like RNA helicase
MLVLGWLVLGNPWGVSQSLSYFDPKLISILFLGDPRRVAVFPLHSSLPSEGQKAVFKRMPPGVVKVVVSGHVGRER